MKHFPLLALALSSTALAHHGQDFFLNLDSRTPEQLKGSTYLSSSWSKVGGEEELGMESGILLGLGKGFAVGVSTEFTDENLESFEYSSVSPMIQWGMAIPDSAFRIGVFASYAISGTSEEDASHTHSSAISFPTIGGNPDAGFFNPDAPLDVGTTHDDDTHDHTHGGIHRHGEDYFTGRFILEWEPMESTLAVFNLITVAGAWNDIALGYSVGIRQQLNHDFALGIEAIGDFGDDAQHDLAAGVYYNPRHDLSLRLGVGTGIGQETADFSILSGLTFRF